MAPYPLELQMSLLIPAMKVVNMAISFTNWYKIVLSSEYTIINLIPPKITCFYRPWCKYNSDHWCTCVSLCCQAWQAQLPALYDVYMQYRYSAAPEHANSATDSSAVFHIDIIS